MVALCTGCRHVEYVSVPTVHTVLRDSIVHDSVDRHHYHNTFIKGDTVHLIDSSVYHHYHNVFLHDSIRDTVPVIDTSAYAAFRAEIDHHKAVARGRLWWAIGIALAFALFIGIALYRKFCPRLIWRNISTD